ncbi:glutamine amidotransferase domain protein, partial [Vibrio parahaemolyticus V-223/04]
LNLY